MSIRKAVGVGRESGASSAGGMVLALLMGLTVAVVALLFLVQSRKLPVAPLPVLGTLQGFSFTNQSGAIFDTGSLKGRAWVADLIFTRCPGPCTKLTQNMALLQERTVGTGLGLVTLTADPGHDVAAVLEAYGRKHGADFSRWQFLTGDKAEINRVAMRQLLLAVEEKPEGERESENDLFLHSTKWVLVDGEGRLRRVGLVVSFAQCRCRTQTISPVC